MATKKESSKYFRILSIDGGGIRGVIPGQVLVALEEKLQTKTKNPQARIGDFFDLIAGTSTGGILTCILLCPDSKNPKSPKFTAKEAVELYLERGDEIFDADTWQKISSGFGMADEKYSAQQLEDTLKEFLEDIRLSQLIKPCLITAYDIKRRRAHFFNQMDAKKKDGHDFYIRDVARATSAAPTFFEAARIHSFAELPYPLVDGGVFANNPTMCAYAEARESFPDKPTAKEMVVLSLGTGHVKKSYPYNKAKDWGKLEWVVPLIDILMSGVSETVDYQLKQIFDSVNANDQYLRINPKLIHANPEMDDVSQMNLRALRQEGIEIAQENDAELDAMVNLLVAK